MCCGKDRHISPLSSSKSMFKRLPLCERAINDALSLAFAERGQIRFGACVFSAKVLHIKFRFLLDLLLLPLYNLSSRKKKDILDIVIASIGFGRATAVEAAKRALQELGNWNRRRRSCSHLSPFAFVSSRGPSDAAAAAVVASSSSSLSAADHKSQFSSTHDVVVVLFVYLSLSRQCSGRSTTDAGY